MWNDHVTLLSQSFRSVDITINTDEDPSLGIESSAIINLRGVFTKLHFKQPVELICNDLILASHEHCKDSLPADNFKKYKKKHTPNNNAIL